MLGVNHTRKQGDHYERSRDTYAQVPEVAAVAQALKRDEKHEHGEQHWPPTDAARTGRQVAVLLVSRRVGQSKLLGRIANRADSTHRKLQVRRALCPRTIYFWHAED